MSAEVLTQPNGLITSQCLVYQYQYISRGLVLPEKSPDNHGRVARFSIGNVNFGPILCEMFYCDSCPKLRVSASKVTEQSSTTLGSVLYQQLQQLPDKNILITDIYIRHFKTRKFLPIFLITLYMQNIHFSEKKNLSVIVRWESHALNFTSKNSFCL